MAVVILRFSGTVKEFREWLENTDLQYEIELSYKRKIHKQTNCR